MSEIRAHASGASSRKASLPRRRFETGLACLALGLAGCAAMDGQTRPDAAMGDSQALRLARLLEEAARTGDPRLEAAQGKMDALEAALIAAPEPALERAEQSQPATLPPAPDTTRMESVFHAVHIASYRSLELARRGWAIYAQNPVLEDLDAVAAPVRLAESGAWYRLKAGPFDTRGAARAACAALEARGEWCAVSDFNGRALNE